MCCKGPIGDFVQTIDFINGSVCGNYTFAVLAVKYIKVGKTYLNDY